MKRYDPESRCPKCWAVGASAQYRVMAKNTDIEDALADTVDEHRETYEVMIRQCKNCLYCWDELPLDAKGAA